MLPTRQLTPGIRANARSLRREMTDAERRLWYFLRRHGMAGFKFRRQHPIGPYIVDFYCAAARLVVEVDGGQHFEPEGRRQDDERTRYLRRCGLRVLRFSNIEVLTQTESVLEVTLKAVEVAPGVGAPLLNPLPSGTRELVRTVSAGVPVLTFQRRPHLPTPRTENTLAYGRSPAPPTA